MTSTPVLDVAASALFAFALIHTFAAKAFEHLARRFPSHAGLLHLLGETEVVFGVWAIVLVAVIALAGGSERAVAYVESRRYTEPLFVFVVMVIAASGPVLHAARAAIAALARLLPLERGVATAWLGFAVLPLAGSLLTEPAAMTLAALALRDTAFRTQVPERTKYFALGTLFVNVSIGGTLTSYAAPPVLMVTAAWNWDTAFMLATFGWKAAAAVLVNATLATWLLRGHLRLPHPDRPRPRVPPAVVLAHLAFLGAVVVLGHHPVLFIGVFLLFLGVVKAYGDNRQPLILREALLVAFFLAGLVVLGGMQQWWLAPLVSGLDADALFFGSLALTAVTDNAALTYLGSLIPGMGEGARYALVAGAVAGGGLTVIANAPNPAGAALLRAGFADAEIGAGGLLAGALVPTAIAAAAFLL